MTFLHDLCCLTYSCLLGRSSPDFSKYVTKNFVSTILNWCFFGVSIKQSVLLCANPRCLCLNPFYRKVSNLCHCLVDVLGTAVSPVFFSLQRHSVLAIEITLNLCKFGFEVQTCSISRISVPKSCCL